MKYWFFNTICLFGLVTNVYSQTRVYGAVVDSESKEPLPFIHILVETSDTILKMQSDINGSYKIPDLIKNQVTLKFAYIGYADLDSSFLIQGDSLELNIQLVEDDSKEYSILISSYNKEGAIRDIEKRQAKLLLPGGLIGTPIHIKDTVFENKYGVKYLSQGCVRMPKEDEEEYNLEIFDYLDFKYGKAWRKEVRKDVIGLKPD